MSRRRAEDRSGRHAGERLLSTLDGGLADCSDPGRQPGAVFEYTIPPDPASMDPVTPALRRRSGPAIRFRTGFQAALLIAGLGLLGAGGFWWQALAGHTEIAAVGAVQSGNPAQEPGASAGAATGSATTGTAAAVPGVQPGPAETAGTLPAAVVHVAGAVHFPGVIALPPGSRVNDAVVAAGGALTGSDPGQLNLAAVITDGQKIYVPLPGEKLPAETGGELPAGGNSPAVGNAPAAGGKVNLNSATPAELATLPKVGPVLAQRIIDWRLEHGPFASVEELDAVDGVGPKLLQTLLPLVTV